MDEQLDEILVSFAKSIELSNAIMPLIENEDLELIIILLQTGLSASIQQKSKKPRRDFLLLSKYFLERSKEYNVH